MQQKKVADQIKAHYGQFTKTQRLIANYISENYRQVPAMSVQELAACLNTSDASIIRFAQSLGYKGYLDMRAALKLEINRYYAPRSRFNRTSADDSSEQERKNETRTLADIIADNDLECHKEFYENFNRALIADAVREINKAGTIHVVGFGTDALLATFLDWYLGLMGYKTMLYTDGGFAASKRISSIEERDLLILFTTPRHLKVEKSIIDTARNVKAGTICVSPKSVLELSSLCDIALSISDRSNELINSYVTYMSLCNMLVMAVYESNEEAISKKLKENENFEKFFDLFL